jgi:hypothetical protein
LGASVVDEFGKPVAGAPVSFFLPTGTEVGAAQTDSSGNALLSVIVSLPAGVYPVRATYGGSGLYEGNIGLGSYTVTQMASSMAYTGALKGGPNKTVTLSAGLVDALNRPLAGKVVVFTLGTQQVQATTDATGLASSPLKLAQKNGKYLLTATWSPSGADATMWTGSSVSTTFAIQSK